MRNENRARNPLTLPCFLSFLRLKNEFRISLCISLCIFIPCRQCHALTDFLIFFCAGHQLASNAVSCSVKKGLGVNSSVGSAMRRGSCCKHISAAMSQACHIGCCNTGPQTTPDTSPQTRNTPQTRLKHSAAISGWEDERSRPC